MDPKSQTKKYKRKGLDVQQERKAKCGHVSRNGRYFNCEECMPVLPEEVGDWTYVNFTDEDV